MKLLQSPAFRRGFMAVTPLWVSALPVALAYIIQARNAGLNPFQIQLMSAMVYHSPIQLVVTQFLVDNAAALTILATVLMMAVHHLLYGLSLTRTLSFGRRERFVAAYSLTDAAYGLTIAQGANMSVPFLLGAELGIFVGWNGATAVAQIFGGLFGDLSRLHLDFVVPLTFFALLVTIVRKRTDLVVALCAVTLSVICVKIGLGSVTVLAVGLTCPLVGVALSRRVPTVPQPEGGV